MTDAKDITFAKERKHVRRAGRIVVESLFAEDDSRRFPRNNYGDFKETLDKYAEERYGVDVSEALAKDTEEVINSTGDDTDLYSTAMASFIDQAYEPRLLGRDVINPVEAPSRGFDSVKIPIGQQLTAQTLNTDGTFPSEETTDYQSRTISFDWRGAYTKIPEQLLQKAIVDLIVERLEQIGRAISRKVDSDIMTEFDKATTKNDGFYGDNSNYDYLGSGNFVDYDAVINAMGELLKQDAEPTHMLMHPDSNVNYLQDADVKQALGFGTTEEGETPLQTVLGNMRILVSPQVPTDTVLLVDSERIGHFLDYGDIQTFDGRVNETVQSEVLGVKPYGVRVTQEEALFAIREDSTEP